MRNNRKYEQSSLTDDQKLALISLYDSALLQADEHANMSVSDVLDQGFFFPIRQCIFSGNYHIALSAMLNIDHYFQYKINEQVELSKQVDNLKKEHMDSTSHEKYLTELRSLLKKLPSDSVLHEFTKLLTKKRDSRNLQSYDKTRLYGSILCKQGDAQEYKTYGQLQQSIFCEGTNARKYANETLKLRNKITSNIQKTWDAIDPNTNTSISRRSPRNKGLRTTYYESDAQVQSDSTVSPSQSTSRSPSPSYQESKKRKRENVETSEHVNEYTTTIINKKKKVIEYPDGYKVIIKTNNHGKHIGARI